MNKTLEEIGQAIFKHWFVDFEFPNEEGKPYKSSGGEMVYNEELGKEIPKGWKVETLGNLIIRNKEKVTNKKGWKEENIIDLSTMPQFSICLDSFQKGEKFDSNVFKLREMDILFGSIRPYFGKAGFSPINGVVTGTIFSYLPRDNNHYAYILFLTTGKDFIDFTVAFSKGTKMPIIGWDDFCSYKLVIPEGGELIERFNDILMPLIIKIKVNIQQIQTLSQARDSLLPKLMSGKIRVPLEEKE
jgi:type I restriction enzyme S subunit